MLLPLSLDCRKAIRLMASQVLLQHFPQLRDQAIAIKRPARLQAHGRPLLVDFIGHLHVYINPDTQHHVTDVGRVPHQLKQDAGDLLLPHQHIVGPFQAHTGNTELAQGLHDGEPHDKAQALQLAHAPLDPQDQAVIDILCEWTDPFSPSPPAARSLPLGKHNKRRNLVPLDGAQGFGIGGIKRVEDQNWPFARGSQSLYLHGIKQSQRRSQLIAASSNLMNGQPQLSLKMLKLLPHSTATDTQGSAQRLARMESAIFKKL
ncbi:hypothetical protein D3C73_1056200 [compost metagenome]